MNQINYIQCNITFVGLKSLIKLQGEDKFKVGAVFGIWLGTVAINVVTVDNLGVGVWFWITGGVLVAVSTSHRRSETIDQSQKEKIGKETGWTDTDKIRCRGCVYFSGVLLHPKLNKPIESICCYGEN